MTKLRPDLSGNPFFAAGLVSAKKDWERKAEMCAQKNPLQNELKGKFYLYKLLSCVHIYVITFLCALVNLSWSSDWIAFQTHFFPLRNPARKSS